MAVAKAGSRWRSVTCDTEVIVVKATAEDIDLECGGQKMAPLGTDVAVDEPAPGLDDGTQLGKRYVDADETVELLCTKPGRGSLTLGGRALTLKEAKPLPSSD